jgi:hypothetical protein
MNVHGGSFPRGAFCSLRAVITRRPGIVREPERSEKYLVATDSIDGRYSGAESPAHAPARWEFAGTGHIDAAEIALTTIATLAAASQGRVLAGIALAAGILIKPFMLLIAPPLWSRWE